MDRTTGATPMAILDGHSSRFHTNLLRYIHDIRHRWGITVGLPYATNKWQIGDTIYQNGMFSMSLNRAKGNLFARKCQHNLLPQIERYEILLLVAEAWGCSFGNVDGNLKASAITGWNPLNRALLDDPEVIRTMTEKDKSEEGDFKYGKAIVALPRVEGIARNTNNAPEIGSIPAGKVTSAPATTSTPWYILVSSPRTPWCILVCYLTSHPMVHSRLLLLYQPPRPYTNSTSGIRCARP